MEACIISKGDTLLKKQGQHHCQSCQERNTPPENLFIFHKDFYVEALQKDFKPNDRVESLLCLTGLDECKVKTLEDCRLNVSRDFNFADDQIRKQYIKTNQYFERVLNEDGRSF